MTATRARGRRRMRRDVDDRHGDSVGVGRIFDIGLSRIAMLRFRSRFR